MGAYIRPPEPASLYRMHAASNGCYRVRNIAIDNELVVTNRTPVGLNRGYGGPQFYFALERLMDIAARGLGLDPAELRRRNFVPPDAFPYRCPAGSILDAGDYAGSPRRAHPSRRLRRFAAPARRGTPRGPTLRHRHRGGNRAVGLQHGLCGAGADRRGARPHRRKSGANASAGLSVDPSGSVTLRLCSTPNGQGHATVAAQIVADALGLVPGDIEVVTEMDTLTSAWSIASGNYSNRFAAIVVGAIAEAAGNVATKIKLIAADALETSADRIELVDGYARVVGQSNKGLPFRRVAARAHWNPAGLPAGWPPGSRRSRCCRRPSSARRTTDDRIASAATYGFVIDLAAIEVDADRRDPHRQVCLGARRRPPAQSAHRRGPDSWRLRPWARRRADGGVCYDEQGNFLSGTFADYLCPTAMEVPPLDHRPCGDAVSHECAGRQGHGRRQLDADARRDRQRGRRCARPRRRRAAADLAPRVGAGQRQDPGAARRTAKNARERRGPHRAA